jgi:acetyl-CoA C-acetyltransferase
MHVASGKFDTVLVVTEEKMSPTHPHPAGAFLTIFDHTTEQPLELTLLHIFGIEMCRFMHRYGWSEEELAQISVLCKGNAMNHPAAQVAEKITVQDVMDSPVLSWPVKRRDISPTSDGAVAIVMTNERVARTHCSAPVFVDGVGFRLDTAYWCTRDLAYPNYVAMAAQDAYKMAGITKPHEQIDIFEPYDPFNYKALHHMNALLQDKSGRTVRELFDAGQLGADGTHPMCPSGGALGVGNPIAATGLMKIAEIYFQLSGQAGARQVKKVARRGVAQAWGDLMQVGTVVVMNSEGAMPDTPSRWSDMKKADLPVTPLKKIEDVANFHYKPDFRYAWDNGMGLTTYLSGLRQGKITASRCSKCSRVMIPPRTFCELCNLHPVHDYCELQDTGTVMSFTKSHVNWDSSMLPDGQVNVFAVIAIDGAFENMGLVHRLKEIGPDDVKIGMKVKAVWKKEKDREGSILDIEHFRPLKKGEKTSTEIVEIKPTELDSTTAKAFPGEIPLEFVYTAGIGGGKFFDDLAAGKLSGTWCPQCEVVHVPPTAFCELTMATLDVQGGAREVQPGSGVVQSFTEVHEGRSGHLLEQPTVIAQVIFPEVVGSVFGILELDPDEDAYIGMPVGLVKTDKVGPEHVRFQSNR